MKFDVGQYFDLVCPVDKIRLRFEKDRLISEAGRTYPVVDGIPVLLVADAEPTIGAASKSLSLALDSSPEAVNPQMAGFYVDALGLSDQERIDLSRVIREKSAKIDPVVAFMVAATNGNAYRQLMGTLDRYPIPSLRLANGAGRRLIDIGCNWGRWSIAAAQRGYEVTGLDPQLGAVMAARRVSRELGLAARFVVADARYMPFADQSFDCGFSYSVLQHLSKDNVGLVLEELGRVLRPHGESLIQMANGRGLRSLWHQARRGFREVQGFDVRYWSPGELRETFARLIGPSEVSVDCFFGLGLQPTDREMYGTPARLALDASEVLRRWSEFARFLTAFADSLYVHSRKVG